QERLDPLQNSQDLRETRTVVAKAARGKNPGQRRQYQQPRPGRADQANDSFRRAERDLHILKFHPDRQPVDGAPQHQLPPSKLQALQLFSSKHARSFLSSSRVAEKDDQSRSRSFSRQRTPIVARE